MVESTPATPISDIQLFRQAFNASPIGIAVENFDGQAVKVAVPYLTDHGQLRSNPKVRFADIRLVRVENGIFAAKQTHAHVLGLFTPIIRVRVFPRSSTECKDASLSISAGRILSHVGELRLSCAH